ncbi:hypothetical protein [Ornithinimicrobium panacihumi]|uniref:hypothetical protein n=1 Tax=Ornithinimicrobium panacihumi TaxID=2008449 RepID=UPI003F8CB5F8
MSYDILLYPREPGQDWQAILDADEADTPQELLDDEAAMNAGVETFRRIESRLRRFVSGETETWVAEETGGDVLGEFTDLASGLQVAVYHGSAAVTFPYRPVDNLAGFHIKVREAVRIVAEETGYEAYDPQRGVDFDGTIDDGPGREAAAKLAAEGGAPAGEAGDGAAGGGLGAEDGLDRGLDRGIDDADTSDLAPPSSAAVVHPSSDEPALGLDGQPVAAEPERELTPREQRLQAMIEARRDPVRVRRRAYFDLALAVAVGIWAFMRQSSGETGFLTTVLFFLAALNLFSGLMALRAASKLETEKAAGSPTDPTGPTPPTDPTDRS